MGQKVSPLGLRLGINQNWRSRWSAPKGKLSLWIKEDLLIRQTLKKVLSNAFIAKVEIERQDEIIYIFLWSSHLGAVLGQGNKNVERIVFILKKVLKKRFCKIRIKVNEVKNPHLNAQLIANDIAYKIVNRENYRVVQKQAIKGAIRSGARGIKVAIAGRLNGADIARREYLSEGKIPLSTLSANIDYGAAQSLTGYGQVGVKVWICHDNLSAKSGVREKMFVEKEKF